MKNLNRFMAMIALLTCSSSAHAFGIIGGANFFNLEAKGNKSDLGFIGGLSFEGFVGPGLRTELDLMYGQNKFNNGSLDVVQVPLLARFTLIPFIDLGVGPYATYILDTSSNHFDIGAVGSLRFHLMPRFTIEGRYLYGFTQLSGNGSETRGLQVLANIRF